MRSVPPEMGRAFMRLGVTVRSNGGTGTMGSSGSAGLIGGRTVSIGNVEVVGATDGAAPWPYTAGASDIPIVVAGPGVRVEPGAQATKAIALTRARAVDRMVHSIR